MERHPTARRCCCSPGPTRKKRENRFELSIPKGASLLLTHDPSGFVRGLDSFEGEHPRVAPVFFGFRIMIGVGLLMLIVAWTSVWVMRKDAANPCLAGPCACGHDVFGFGRERVAGWYVSEIGRQPWLVQGVLKTADAVGPVGAAPIAMSLLTYLVLYLVLLATYVSVIFYLAAQAATGRIPRRREQLDNPMEPARA
ncbi:MAG: cytochrome ubiquinol oxidase subunit I [Woeseiaceae bacterium]|nr:cytochrome ubiquinol oxidase subunit I [Woeseiaceae bacterium]